MVGYHWSAFKVFWSFYSVFCSLLIFNYFGMLLVVVTPNVHVAFTLRSSFYSIVNLFAGYVMPKPVSPLTSLHQVCQIRFLLCKRKKKSFENYQDMRMWELFVVEAEHTEMVDLDVLFESDVMGFEWIAHIAVWRYGERDHSIWREEESFSFLGRLFWLQI